MEIKIGAHENVEKININGNPTEMVRIIFQQCHTG